MGRPRPHPAVLRHKGSIDSDVATRLDGLRDLWSAITLPKSARSAVRTRRFITELSG